MKKEIVLNEFETQLTVRGLFSVYQQFYDQGMSGPKAYDKVVDYCIDNKFAINYASYASFKDAYYSNNKKYFRKNSQES